MGKPYRKAKGKPASNHKAVTFTRPKELVIPELEAALENLRRPWTPEEEAILEKYYYPGMVKILVSIPRR